MESGLTMERLVSSRKELVARLDDLRGRRAELERERADVRSAIAALEGEAAGRHAELAYQVEDAEATMAEYHSSTETHAAAREAARALRRQLADVEAMIAREVPPLAVRREALEAELERVRGQEMTWSDELASTEAAIRTLEGEQQSERARELEHQLAELEPVVREAAGTGVANLAEDYQSQAARHARAWRLWGAVLVVTLCTAVLGSLMLFAVGRIPDGEIESQAVVAVVRNLFVVGLLLYAVRLASLQFRVHRHLEEVARNKAAALSTFNRVIGVASEKDVRSAIATVLAQAVFSSEDTGFIDSSDGHVTLVERVAAGLPRGPLQ